MNMPSTPDTHADTRTLSAVLGPTNTGKTHLAIERMLAHQNGMIGLPLRLLAREVYNKVAARVGEDQVALVTGEEKIKPENPRYYVCTVEAMPRDITVAFLAIDEVQLAADFDRGHVFTDRMLRMRGSQETLLLGAQTIRPLIETLLPGANILSRPRMSELRYAGQTKLTRLPPRSAIVAFSASEVYAIAELIRRQRGGAAVVLGALSPRTRNAQVGLYQSGEVDYLIATDAIGMGLNLDIDHVAFAADRKFDGHQYRKLNPAEMGQIAGRAGRHLQHGTFGVTARVDPLDDDLIERLESHNFEALRLLQWRNAQLDFSSIGALKGSLAVTPTRPGLTRAPAAEDEVALEILIGDEEIRTLCDDNGQVERLWNTCQIPDYRKIAPANHAELCASVFRFLARDGHIADDWFARQLDQSDRTDGDIDTLSNRIAHVRSWAFIANRPDWLSDTQYWLGRTREIEDRLSDALHERLTQRFIDRRTSVLMRRLRENADLDMELRSGDVYVEGQHVGQLHGFRFAPDPAAGGTHGKALRAAALKGLANEYRKRAMNLAEAKNEEVVLADDGVIRWQGEAIARLAPSEQLLSPRVDLLVDEQLQPADRQKVSEKLQSWLVAHIAQIAEPLVALQNSDELTGIARGIGFRIVENFGVLPRKSVAEELRSLDQDARRILRRKGVRFGAHAVFVPAMLKPAAARLTRLLWVLRKGYLDKDLIDRLPVLSAQGLMSVAIDPEVPEDYYLATGYMRYGRRVVRVDMLERLADLIRPLVSWKPESKPAETTPAETPADSGTAVARSEPAEPQTSSEGEAAGSEDSTEKVATADETTPVSAQTDTQMSAPAPQVTSGPEGALGHGKFHVTPQMMSLVGCSGEDFADILKGIGFQQVGVITQARVATAPRDSEGEGETAPEATIREITIWRPRGPAREGRGKGGGRGHHHAPAQDAGRSDGKHHEGPRGRGTGERSHGKPGKRRGKPHPGKERSREDRHAGAQAGDRPARKGDRQPDPLSPFAALAGLKEELLAGRRGRDDK